MATINLRNVDLNLLLVFDRMLVEKRVSAVAQVLGLSQPAISNALAAQSGNTINSAGLTDIAITWGTERSQHEGRATRLLVGDSVAVANPALIAREGPFERSHALLHAPLLHDTDRQGWQRFMRKLGLRHANQESGPVFEDFNLLRAAALAGQGLALCPRSLIQDDVSAGRLVVLFEGTAINEDLGYWLVEPHNTEGRASAIGAFKAWLMKEAGA